MSSDAEPTFEVNFVDDDELLAAIEAELATGQPGNAALVIDIARFMLMSGMLKATLHTRGEAGCSTLAGAVLTALPLAIAMHVKEACEDPAGAIDWIANLARRQLAALDQLPQSHRGMH